MVRIPLAVIVAALALSAGCKSDDHNRRADVSDRPGIYYDASTGIYHDRDTSTDTSDYQRSANTSNFVQDDYFGDGAKPLQNPDVYATPRDTTYDPNYPDHTRDIYPAPREPAPKHPRDNR